MAKNISARRFREVISIDELYHPQDFAAIDQDSMINLHGLHYRLNFVRRIYGKPMVINSGFRTNEEQIAIYKKLGRPPILGSEHLCGAAADISDPNGELKRWILDHLEIVEMMNLYFEDFTFTGGLKSGWVHAQIYSPPSLKRFFIP